MPFYFFLFVVFFWSCADLKPTKEVSEPTIESISKELLKFPNDTVLLKQRCNIYLEKGNWSQAILDQEQLFKLDTTNSKCRYELAQLYFNYIDSNPAYFNKSYDLLDRAETNYTPLYLLRGKLNYIIQNYEQSFIDINAYLKQIPNDYQGYYYKGLIFKEIGDIDRAKSQFHTAIEQFPNHIQSYVELGHIYSSLGDSLAPYYYENALRIDTTKLSSWYHIGLYFQNHGNFPKAKTAYDAILKIDPLDIDANYNLGFIHLRKQDYASAINYFETVTMTHPSHSSAFFALGLASKLSGDIEQAKKYFQKTLELDSNFTEARRELNEMK